MSTVSSQRYTRRKNGSDSSIRIESVSKIGNADFESRERSLLCLLNEVHDELVSPGVNPPRVQQAIDKLFRGLREVRQTASANEWKKLIRIGRAHPLRCLVHEDPFTARAFHKPRKYAGDAVMMDYIYGREEDWTPPAASELGAAIFDYTTSAPASSGVRERRCYIAEMLDEIGRTQTESAVLSVAAGHLREAGLSRAVRRNSFERFVAMDADEQSLDEIEKRYGKYGVEPIVANVRRMLTGPLDLGSFDVIYSTGLYDYLADSTAKRLTANLFDCLRPQGKLVVANFLPEIRDVGYMEMYMDWHLIYRNRGEMMALADNIVQSQVREIRMVAERNENVVIMELTKR